MKHALTWASVAFDLDLCTGSSFCTEQRSSALGIARRPQPKSSSWPQVSSKRSLIFFFDDQAGVARSPRAPWSTLPIRGDTCTPLQGNSSKSNQMASMTLRTGAAFQTCWKIRLHGVHLRIAAEGQCPQRVWVGADVGGHWVCAQRGADTRVQKGASVSSECSTFVIHSRK